MVSIDTLVWMLKTFLTYQYKCQNICDTIVWMSEYFLMWKYSLVGCRTLILYDNIVGRYVNIDNLTFMSPFNTTIYLKYILKECFKRFPFLEVCKNIAEHELWIQHRIIENVIGWSKVNHKNTLKGIIQKYQLSKARDRHPSRKGIGIRRHVSRTKVWISKTIPRSSLGAAT